MPARAPGTQIDEEMARRGVFESRPNPDPSTLTTAQLEKSIVCLREIFEAKLTGLRETFEARLHAMDQDFGLLRCEIEKFPELRHKAVEELHGLMDEKFRSVEIRFVELNTRTDKIAELNQKALDAALLTAEKAVGKQTEVFSVATAKSEATTKERLDQIGVIIATTNRATDERTNAIKERLDRGEGHKKGIGDGWGVLVGAVGLLALLAGVVIAALALVRH